MIILIESYLSIIVGGDLIAEDESSQPEVVLLPKLGLKYTHLSSFPQSMPNNGIIGMRNNHSFTICGNINYTMLCQSLRIMELFSTSWTQLDIPIKERSFAATVPMLGHDKHQWLITGGIVYNPDESKVLSMSEIFSIPNVSLGPSLPEPTSMHCMTRLDSETIISTGGSGTTFRAQSFALKLGPKTVWANLSGMNQARHGHACGHYGNDLILVAGGLNIKSTEIFDVTTGHW